MNGALGERVLRDLAAVGYDAEWHCIPASALGAPHRRDRLWILAFAAGKRFQGSGNARQRQGINREDRQAIEPLRDGSLRFGKFMADTIRQRQSGPRQSIESLNQEAGSNRQAVDAFASRVRDIWATEPAVGRVANGVSNRVDRLRGLGNAVVPQIPELIGRAIMEASR